MSLEATAAPRVSPASPVTAPAPGPRWATDLAVLFGTVYVVLLLCLPSQLILKPLGAPGTPANLWAVAGLVVWGAMTVGGLNPVRGITRTRAALAVLVAAVLASYANGMTNGWFAPRSVRGVNDDVISLVSPTVAEVTSAMVRSADRGLLSMAGWVGVVLVLAEGLRSWSDVERLVGWLTTLGAVVAVIGIVQFFTGLDVVRFIQVPGLTLNTDLGGIQARSVLNRVSATAVHPIEFGTVLACLFPLALHRTIHRWGRRWALLPTGVIFVGAFMSVSRSAMLALAVIAVVLALGWPARWRLRALWLAPLAVVGLRVAIPGLVGTLVSLFTNLGNDPSVEGRTGDYGVLLDVASQHLLLGRGFFTFVPQYYRIVDNQLLLALVEMGLVGLAAVLVFLLTTYFSARTARRRTVDPRRRHLALCLSASVAAGAIAMTTFDAWGFPMFAGLSFLLAGLCGAVLRLSATPSSSGTPTSSSTPRPGGVVTRG